MSQILCPKCGSDQVTADKKGFSGKKAVAGAVLTGGIGILAGTLGSNKIKITCLSCGNVFKPGQGASSVADFNKKKADEKSAQKGCAVLIAVIFVIYFFSKIFGCGDEEKKSTSNSQQNSTTSSSPAPLTKQQQDSLDKVEALAQKKWDNSKAGKLQKKHTDWTNEECELVAQHKIWIGMRIDMLRAERGNPNSATPSNYGDGNNWQWCWDDYTPSCFYGGEDGIITSYN